MISFASDNHAGVHPELFHAMMEVNSGYAPSYEQDEVSQKVRKQILTLFDAKDCALVFNGTAANVLCLQMGLETYEAVLCADSSHLHRDECGAPEKIAGVKLLAQPHHHGRLHIEELEKSIERRGDQHFSQIRMLSITQPTEYGTVYSLDELRRLREFCDRHHLLLHVDGARLSNAAVTLNCDLLSATGGADLISWGGAKKGLLLGEWVIVRNSTLPKKLKFLRKQSLQLPAKTRFLSAAYQHYLKDSFYQNQAQHENAMALALAETIRNETAWLITRPVEANAVFCVIPQPLVKALREKFFFYVWDEKKFEVRLMTSFQTTPTEIDLWREHLRLVINTHQ